MNAEALLRIVALCVVLACAETLHGIFRIKVFIPRLGKDRAIKLSALTGSLLALAICLVLVPGIRIRGPSAHLALGIALAAFMAAFDVGIGMGLMRKPWAKIRPDFDPRSGNYLSLGLFALCWMPLAVWWLGRR